MANTIVGRAYLVREIKQRNYIKNKAEKIKIDNFTIEKSPIILSQYWEAQ